MSCNTVKKNGFITKYYQPKKYYITSLYHKLSLIVCTTSPVRYLLLLTLRFCSSSVQQGGEGGGRGGMFTTSRGQAGRPLEGSSFTFLHLPPLTHPPPTPLPPPPTAAARIFFLSLSCSQLDPGASFLSTRIRILSKLKTYKQNFYFVKKKTFLRQFSAKILSDPDLAKYFGP